MKKTALILMATALMAWGQTAAACSLASGFMETQYLGGAAGKQLMVTGGVNNAYEGRAYFAAYDIDPVTDAAKLAIYRDNGSGRFMPDYVWDPGAGRVLWSATILYARNMVWAVGAHCDTTAVYEGHDCKITILKRATSGTWSQVYNAPTYNTRNVIIAAAAGRVPSRVGASAPGAELFVTGWGYEDPVGRPRKPSPGKPRTRDLLLRDRMGKEVRYGGFMEPWLVLKYSESEGTLTTMNVTPTDGVYTGLTDDNACEPNFIRLAPNGKMWVGGRQEDNVDDVHGLLMEENAAGDRFVPILDYRKNPMASKPGEGDQDSGDRLRDVSFDAAGNYYMPHSYWYPYGSAPDSRLFTYSQVLKGTVANPGSFTILEDQNNYFTGKTTLYFESLWHSSGQLFLSGMADNSDGYAYPTIDMSIARRGGANGPFVNAGSGYSHPIMSGGDAYSQSYVKPPLVEDNGANVWQFVSSILSSDTTHWGARSQVIVRKLACQ